MIHTLAKWIGTFPGWHGQRVTVNSLCQKTGSVGIFSKGTQVLEEKTDIMGNRKEHCRHSFILRFRAPAFSGDGYDVAVNFQRWVQQHNALGLAPRFGDIPTHSYIQTSGGKAEGTDGTDAVTYTVELTADYIKIYEVK